MGFRCVNGGITGVHCSEQCEVCEMTEQHRQDKAKGEYLKFNFLERSENGVKVTPETIQKACDELARTLIRKNHDYGNSVEEQFNEYGETSLIIRLEDKLRRLKNLIKNKSMVKSEKKAETWIDAAGYSVLAYIIHSENEKEKE
jgi:hypothetical protein